MGGSRCAEALGSNPREDDGELVEGRRKKEDEALPGNLATTATTPEPRRRHGERGDRVMAEADGTKREVPRKEQRRSGEADPTGIGERLQEVRE